MNLHIAQKNDALKIAEIHKTEINKGFLSSLSISFLQKFYSALIESDASFCIVAKEQERVIGFISGVTNLNTYYVYFFKKYFFHSAFILLPKIFNVSSLRKIFETLWYPLQEKELPQAELLTMAVMREFQGKGIAGQLFLEFISEMKKRNIKRFKVMVGDELKPAIHFYEKNGFTFLKNIHIHGNITSRVYIYDIT